MTEGPGRMIVFVAGKDPEYEAGGHSSYVRAHARAAMKAGFEPHLFCVGLEDAVLNLEYGVLHKVRSPYRPFRALMSPLHGSLLVEPMVRFMSGIPGPHLVHAFGVWGWAGNRAKKRLATRGVAVRLITSSYTTMEHEAAAKLTSVALTPANRLQLQVELLWTRGVVRRFEREGYLEADAVTVNYDSVRRLMLEEWPGLSLTRVPYASERAFIKQNGAQVPASIQRLQPADAPLVVSVSRHDARKGLDILLHALEALKRKEVPFRAALVGGGWLLELHRKMAVPMKFGESVAIEGRVPCSWSYLRQADIFVLPSLEEGSGSMSLLEALQAGAAIVASDLDGIPEDVADGESALLVEPGNPAALADALARVLTDHGLRDRLRRAAAATFERRFTAEVLTTALRDLYAKHGLTEEPSPQP